jgi:hypothetical protein
VSDEVSSVFFSYSSYMIKYSKETITTTVQYKVATENNITIEIHYHLLPIVPTIEGSGKPRSCGLTPREAYPDKKCDPS